ncbi:MAG: hypothetical protein ACXWC6_06365 [Ramlibacter sp.]
MAFTVTSRRRQLAMAVMLALAAGGAVLRWRAPQPSTLRDIGTLLLVLWIPAVGNLIGFVVRKLPRPAPVPTQFPDGAPFTRQMTADLERVALPVGFMASLDPADARGTVITGRQGFTVRLDRPMAQWLADGGGGPQPVPLQFLLPQVALRALAPGMPIHLLVGEKTVVAKGRVLALDAPA